MSFMYVYIKPMTMIIFNCNASTYNYLTDTSEYCQLCWIYRKLKLLHIPSPSPRICYKDYSQAHLQIIFTKWTTHLCPPEEGCHQARRLFNNILGKTQYNGTL